MDMKNWNKSKATYSFSDKYGNEWEARPSGDLYRLTMNGDLFQPNAEGWSQPEEGWSLDCCSFWVGDYLGQRKRRENTLYMSIGKKGQVVFS